MCFTDEMVAFLYGFSATERYVFAYRRIVARLPIGTGIKLPSLPEGLLAWIPKIWKVTDDLILEAAGLDAYVVSASAASG